MKHRKEGYALLRGKGLEIGAFHEPACLPENCSVSYFDALDREQAAKRFPEIDSTRLVNIDIIGDIDQRDLKKSVPGNSLDFVIANHVIEHVASPIAMIEDVTAILKEGGVDRIMLDNFSVEEVAQTVKEIDGKVPLEATGGITMENIVDYAETGVDYVSSGLMTHSFKIIDVSLKASLS